MICEWNAIRYKEIYFIRKIYHLNNIKEERELENKYFKTHVVIKKHEVELKNKDKDNKNAKEVVQNNSLDCAINKEQLEISQQSLLESYIKEENNSQSYNDFINSLGDEELCNLDNAMEGLDIISNNSIEVKAELMDQESCNHDWIKGRGDYNIKCVFYILS
jgi:hypothetical protein